MPILQDWLRSVARSLNINQIINQILPAENAERHKTTFYDFRVTYNLGGKKYSREVNREHVLRNTGFKENNLFNFKENIY